MFVGGCQVVFTGSATFIVSSPARGDQIWICDNDEEAKTWVEVIAASISRVDFKISHVCFFFRLTVDEKKMNFSVDD